MEVEQTVPNSNGKRQHFCRPSTNINSADVQPVLYRDASLRARVPWEVLEGGSVGPFKKGYLTRMLRHLRPKAAVKIEPLDAPGLSASVLYAPEDIPADSEIPFVETMLIGGTPHGKLVYQDSPFEIRVAGMLVKNFDKYYHLRGAGRNELLMYSVQTDPKSSGENGDSLPFIHFDHRSDAYQSIERANTYVPIPASKAYVTGSKGKPTRKNGRRRGGPVGRRA